ncbi:DinB family protein [Flavobacterium humi]|uniref:DinB family protein n=1 Tax=Flavobacterium humi TaxID=2562683 RepID=A0A4Z0L7K4_9FLAO|nr:DinB family protein [Flavobacterium humi]TGD57992.1 DinB family protein [Flavobacterium humi]
MDASLKESLWKQFGATIDMLENAIRLCPESVWDSELKYWYSAYHTIFYLDYYLSYDPENFRPPAPYTLSEFDPDGAYPDRVYSQEELLEYLEFAREKCFTLITTLTEEKAKYRFVNPYRDYSIFEMLLYNMRHVQHHVAQLNLLLRQDIDDAPKWVSQTQKTY